MVDATLQIPLVLKKLILKRFVALAVVVPAAR
jgi:hypothetical protein